MRPRGTKEEDMVIMVNEVSGVFKAPARRTICVELLEEKTHERDDVGFLLQTKLLWDQRLRAPIFRDEVRKVLRGSRREASTIPSTYYHENVGTEDIVHGNDFISWRTEKF